MLSLRIDLLLLRAVSIVPVHTLHGWWFDEETDKKNNAKIFNIIRGHLSSTFEYTVRVLLCALLKILPKFNWRVNLKKG